MTLWCFEDLGVGSVSLDSKLVKRFLKYNLYMPSVLKSILLITLLLFNLNFLFVWLTRLRGERECLRVRRGRGWVRSGRPWVSFLRCHPLFETGSSRGSGTHPARLLASEPPGSPTCLCFPRTGNTDVQGHACFLTSAGIKLRSSPSHFTIKPSPVLQTFCQSRRKLALILRILWYLHMFF